MVRGFQGYFCLTHAGTMSVYTQFVNNAGKEQSLYNQQSMTNNNPTLELREKMVITTTLGPRSYEIPSELGVIPSIEIKAK